MITVNLQGNRFFHKYNSNAKCFVTKNIQVKKKMGKTFRKKKTRIMYSLVKKS